MADTGLEEKVAFLQLECGFYRHFLTARSVVTAADVGGTRRHPLQLHEKLELCAMETNAMRGQIEQVQRDGELEVACALAAIADCRQHQGAETARNLTVLLNVLGIAPDSRAPPAPASPSPPAALAAGADTQQAGSSGSSATPPISASTSAGQGEAAAAALPHALLNLPTAKKLAKAELDGARLEEYLSGILARHDAAAARLHMRNAMLQSQLGRVEGTLATKAAQGGARSLHRVDFDQLRIERAQAEAEMAAASAGAIALKAQVVRAQRHLANQRGTLANTAADAAQLRRQIGGLEAHAAQLLADATKVRREYGVLEGECRRLQEQGKGKKGPPGTHTAGSRAGSRGVSAAAAGPDSHAPPAADEAGVGLNGADGSDSVTILDYMRVKNACAEMSKKVANWQRKLEVQAGRRQPSSTMNRAA